MQLPIRCGRRGILLESDDKEPGLAWEHDWVEAKQKRIVVKRGEGEDLLTGPRLEIYIISLTRDVVVMTMQN